MVLLRSSGAFGGMHVKLANGLTRHNWLANAFVGGGLHWDNSILVNAAQSSDHPEHAVDLGERIIANSLIESFSNPLKRVFVGCGRITAYTEVTQILGQFRG
jgi:hypothetical protein